MTSDRPASAPPPSVGTCWLTAAVLRVQVVGNLVEHTLDALCLSSVTRGVGGRLFGVSGHEVTGKAGHEHDAAT